MIYEVPAPMSAYTMPAGGQLSPDPFSALIDHNNATRYIPEPPNTPHHLEASGFFAGSPSNLSDLPGSYLGHHHYHGHAPPAPLVWAADGTLGGAPRQDLIDNASLLATEPVNKPGDTPVEKLEHAYIQHTDENEMLFAGLSESEQTIIRLDGGNSVESQLMVYHTIMHYPADDDNMRVWRKVETTTPSGRKKAEYHCNGLDDKGAPCDHKYGNLQKARQHFVSCHVGEPCWACPIAGCPDPRKYKRLDDLKHHHMVPFHQVDYSRSKVRGMAPRPTPAVDRSRLISNTARATGPYHKGVPVPPASSTSRPPISSPSAGPSRSGAHSSLAARHHTDPCDSRRGPHSRDTTGASTLRSKRGGRSYYSAPVPSQTFNCDTTSLDPVSQAEVCNAALSQQLDPLHGSRWSNFSSPYLDPALASLSHSPSSFKGDHPVTSPAPLFGGTAGSLTHSPGFVGTPTADSALSPGGYGEAARLSMLSRRSLTRSPAYLDPRRSSPAHQAPYNFSPQRLRQPYRPNTAPADSRFASDEWINPIRRTPDDPAARTLSNFHSPAPAGGFSGHQQSINHHHHQHLRTAPGRSQAYVGGTSPTPLGTVSTNGDPSLQRQPSSSTQLFRGMNGRTTFALPESTRSPPGLTIPATSGQSYMPYLSPLQTEGLVARVDENIFDALHLDPRGAAMNPIPQRTSPYYPHSQAMSGGWRYPSSHADQTEPPQ